jgi:hypothetical protein
MSERDDLYQQLEEVISAIHKNEYEDNEDTRDAVVTSYVVSYEYSNVVDVDGTGVVGYANNWLIGDGSPNTAANIAHWTSRAINMHLFNAGDEDE